MLLKLLKNDILKKKAISLILFAFVLISAFLVASGCSLIVQLNNSMTHFFTTARAPHYIQMHTGELNQASIYSWTEENPTVEATQIVEMVQINGSDITLGNSVTSEASSVMSFDFVRQNSAFDFLLDLSRVKWRPISKLMRLACQIYFMQHHNLRIGDKVRINHEQLFKEFTIVAFVRDALMNPSIIHSKRFVVSQEDLALLQPAGQRQYLIEFLLKDIQNINAFTQAYHSSGLPKNGPSLDYRVLPLLHSVTDGLVIGVLLIVSLLLMAIAMLSLRFAILAALEEEYRPIGIMKALGIPSSFLKQMYLSKYAAISAAACTAGYLCSLCVNSLIVAHIKLYLGDVPLSIWQKGLPLLSVGIIFLIVMGFCVLVCRKFKQITPISALREAGFSAKYPLLPIPVLRCLPVVLGVRDVLQRNKHFLLLFIVFLVCTFIALVPLHMLKTLQAPSFISYMGVGRSDLRIDMPLGSQQISNLAAALQSDPEVKKYAITMTGRFKARNQQHEQALITIETGDISSFPVQYLKGSAPLTSNQIALSYLNSIQLGKNVGDTIEVFVSGKWVEMQVCGIYQDITMGGITAKAQVPIDPNAVLWQVINVDVNASLQKKVEEYSRLFYPAKVRSIDGYLSQTLGDLTRYLKLMAYVSLTVALCVAALIASLFLKLLVAKDRRQIAIMKALGFSLAELKVNYLTRILVVLTPGIILGTCLSNYLGQGLVSAVWSLMGAPAVQFIISPIDVYILCPLALTAAVTFSTFLSTRAIARINLAQQVVE